MQLIVLIQVPENIMLGMGGNPTLRVILTAGPGTEQPEFIGLRRCTRRGRSHRSNTSTLSHLFSGVIYHMILF
jgi:hypothetical protein